MKNLSIILIAIFSIVSCEKVQQHKDTLIKADSLLIQASESFKSLDSISKIVNDSAKLKNIVLPELEKYSTDIENIVKNKNINIDSLSADLKNAAKKAGKSADVIKKIDSVTNIVENSNNPLEKIRAITDAVNSVVKQKSDEKPEVNSPENKLEESSEDFQKPESKLRVNDPSLNEIKSDPITKTLKIDIKVADLFSSKNKLQQILSMYSVSSTQESFSSQEGINFQKIEGMIPQRNFEEFTNQISNELGEVYSKNIDSKGRDNDPNIMQIFSITLQENSLENINSLQQKEDQFSNQSTSAFMKGFDGIKTVFLALLPFWPVLLLLLIGIYFYVKSQKNKSKNTNTDNDINIEN